MLFSATLLGLLLTVTPQVDPPPPSAKAAPLGPQVKVSADRFDFGTVLAGAAVAGELTIDNVGDAPLKLLRIGVTCECAKLHLASATRLNVPIDSADEGRTDLTLAAGEQATLKISIDTAKLATGPFEKRLLILCTDPKKSPLSIPFKLQIERPVRNDTLPPDDPAKQPEPPPAPQLEPGMVPRLEVDSYKAEFGTVYRGEKLHHTFQLKNSGQSDLVVQEIRNSCACAAGKLTLDDETWNEEELRDAKRLGILSPGETAELEVELKTAKATLPGKDTLLSKVIRIYTSDPARNPVTLTLEATMISPFTIEPESFDFGMVRKGAGAKQEAILWSDQLGDFKITQATSGNPELLTVTVTRVDRADVPPTWKITAEISPAAALGSFASHVELTVDHERVKEIVIPVHLTVEPNVDFIDNRPDQATLLDFEVMTIGTGKTIELKIENGDKSVPYVPTNVELTNCKPTREGFSAELVEIEKGIKYLVKVTAPATMGKATYFQGELVITADHPDVPLKKLRYRGWYQAIKGGS